MRRNAAGQKVQVMMRTSAAAITAVVSPATRSVSAATNATPIVITTTASHGAIPGNRIEISGVGGNTAANGTFVAKSVTSTTITLGDSVDGTNVAGNGAYTSGGTVTIQAVNVYVSKDGGALTTGAGTLSHIGKGPLNIAHSPDINQLRALTAITSSTTVAGATAVTVANGGISSSTYGLWSYTPTADETNAAAVSFIFTAPAVGAISVTQSFEPTSGPILYQASLSATGGSVTNQTTIVLPSATPIPAADNDAYNNCDIVFYDSSTSGQVSVGVVLDYVGSTRTITLREAPTFTITASDYVTIIASQTIKSATKDRNIVIDAAGLADANTVKVGPTGSGTAQTARDIGASVLLSAGTGAGQLDFTSGVVKANATQLLGTAWLTPGTAGTPDVNAKLIGATSQTGVDLGATRAEPGQGTPGATISFLSKIDYLYKAWRNKKTQTATTFSLFNDDAATVDQKATSTDDGTTTTIAEMISGP